MNYCTPYPIAESVRDYFSHDVVRTVHIGVELAPIAGLEQPPLNPFANLLRVLADRLKVEKAALARVAFFGCDNLNPNQLRFVGQHVDETSVRNLDKVLIGTLAQLNALLPAIVLADDKRPNTHQCRQLNDAFAGLMQVSINTAVTFMGESLNAWARAGLLTACAV